MGRIITYLVKICLACIFVSGINGCGGESQGEVQSSVNNQSITKLPTALQKLQVGDGVLSAFVVIDGNDENPFAMQINDDETATVTIPQLSRARHTVEIVYAYTDNIDTIILASQLTEADLSGGSVNFEVDVDAYEIAIYDEDRDGISNADELIRQTDPRVQNGTEVIRVVATPPDIGLGLEGAGILVGFVTLDGRSNRFEMTRNVDGLYEVTILNLTQEKHQVFVNFEFVGSLGALTLSAFNQEVDLTILAADLALGINDFTTDFDADNDGFLNLLEIQVGSNAYVKTKPFIAASASLNFEKVKTFTFNWDDVIDANYYRLFENINGTSTFQKISNDIAQGTQTFDRIVPLFDRLSTLYMLQSCNEQGCTDGDVINVTGSLVGSIGVFNGPDASIDMSDDASVFVISDSDRINVSTYAFSNDEWSLESSLVGTRVATDVFNQPVVAPGAFGVQVTLSKDGNTLAVADATDINNALGVNELLASGTGSVYSDSGAVYIYTRVNNQWVEQAYIKASNLGANDHFGESLSMSDDGNTLVVGAPDEDSGSIGTALNIDQLDNLSENAGAAYVFIRVGTAWQQQAYIKSSNTDALDRFGSSLQLSGDGKILAVGASSESSNGVGIESNQLNNDASFSGAVYVFGFNAAQNTWQQEAYIKASNADAQDQFGWRIDLNNAGNILAISAPGEDSAVVTDLNNNLAIDSGAVYVFQRDGVNWLQQSYIKPHNIAVSGGEAFNGINLSGGFGSDLSLSSVGDLLAVGDAFENSNDIGLNGDGSISVNRRSGAAYVFKFETDWRQQAYVKADRSSRDDLFGAALRLSGDGSALLVGSKGSAIDGASYLY